LNGTAAYSRNCVESILYTRIRIDIVYMSLLKPASLGFLICNIRLVTTWLSWITHKRNQYGSDYTRPSNWKEDNSQSEFTESELKMKVIRRKPQYSQRILETFRCGTPRTLLICLEGAHFWDDEPQNIEEKCWEPKATV
jgi:hypothetical protein